MFLTITLSFQNYMYEVVIICYDIYVAVKRAIVSMPCRTQLMVKILHVRT